MKARVALYEEPGGRLIIRGEGSPTAFLILDFLPGSFRPMRRSWQPVRSNTGATMKPGLRTAPTLRPSIIASLRSTLASFPLTTCPIELVSSSLCGRTGSCCSASPAAVIEARRMSRAGELDVMSAQAAQGPSGMGDLDTFRAFRPPIHRGPLLWSAGEGFGPIGTSSAQSA